jgi:hypothetical protein
MGVDKLGNHHLGVFHVRRFRSLYGKLRLAAVSRNAQARIWTVFYRRANDSNAQASTQTVTRSPSRPLPGSSPGLGMPERGSSWRPTSRQWELTRCGVYREAQARHVAQPPRTLDVRWSNSCRRSRTIPLPAQVAATMAVSIDDPTGPNPDGCVPGLAAALLSAESFIVYQRVTPQIGAA